MPKKILVLVFGLTFYFLTFKFSYATPSTHIWAPSTDIQPYKKIHLTADNYSPMPKKATDSNNYDQHLYVQQVYGLTFSLLSDKPQENLLGRFWGPLGKVMAETGFDYKKGFGPAIDNYLWYFHFKAGVGEDAYFKNMPALAAGIYDAGTKRHKTNNNIVYWKAAKTISLKGINLGRFSGGYFTGNGRLLRNETGIRNNSGGMFAWERTMSEISDKLWLCVDYQGSHSAYGAMNYGFAWSFTKDISVIIGYDIYKNKSLADTVTFQLDWNF